MTVPSNKFFNFFDSYNEKNEKSTYWQVHYIYLHIFFCLLLLCQKCQLVMWNLFLTMWEMELFHFLSYTYQTLLYYTSNFCRCAIICITPCSFCQKITATSILSLQCQQLFMNYLSISPIYLYLYLYTILTKN